MLSMTILCVSLLLLFCIVGFAFYMLLTEQQRGQGVTDRVALSIAKAINEGDRIGELGNLIALNRELVYTSRNVANYTCNNRDMVFATPLASLLLDEARSSTTDLDKARLLQIQMIKATIKYQVNNYNVNTKVAAHFLLPWWSSYEPQIYQVTCGTILNTSSNVLHNNFFPDLNDEDTRNRYIQPKSNLYNGTIDARLPAPDSDLSFKLTSLSAPVDQTIAPARLVNPEMFKPMANVYENGKYVDTPMPQIPTAIQVFAKMKVASNSNKQDMIVGSVAACNGAVPLPATNEELGIEEGPINKNAWGQSKPLQY